MVKSTEMLELTCNSRDMRVSSIRQYGATLQAPSRWFSDHDLRSKSLGISPEVIPLLSDPKLVCVLIVQARQPFADKNGREGQLQVLVEVLQKTWGLWRCIRSLLRPEMPLANYARTKSSTATSDETDVRETVAGRTRSVQISRDSGRALQPRTGLEKLSSSHRLR
jgi:hypothetical protein